MTSCMSPYHGDGGSNNDFADSNMLIIRFFTQNWGSSHSNINVMYSELPGLEVLTGFHKKVRLMI